MSKRFEHGSVLCQPFAPCSVYFMLRRPALLTFGATVAVLGLLGFWATVNRPANVTDGWDEPPNYSMVVHYEAFDADAGEYQLTVVNHEVVEFERIDHRGPLFDEERMNIQDFSLRQIVGLYRASLVHREATQSITFDSGDIPTRVTIDWHPDTPTNEQSWKISEFNIS